MTRLGHNMVSASSSAVHHSSCSCDYNVIGQCWDQSNIYIRNIATQLCKDINICHEHILQRAGRSIISSHAGSPLRRTICSFRAPRPL